MTGAPDLSELRIDRTGGARPSRGGGARVAWVLVGLLAAAFALYAAWTEGLLGERRPRVTVARVVRTGAAPAATGISANGHVVARRQAALSTDIQGRLVQLTVQEGDRVDEGDLVARLDTRELQAALAGARAELERARATLALTDVELERQQALLPTGDTTVADLDAARAARDQARAQVDALAAAVEETAIRIDKSSVYAPFDGVVTAKNAEIGEVVSSISGAGPNARAAVVTVVDFDTLEVQVELAQTSLGGVDVGGPVEIYLDAWPTRAYRGRVRQVWPTANRQKATVEVRCTFLERDERILPEMGVRVVFLDERREAEPQGGERVLLPAAAVLGGEGERFVFVVRDGRLERRPVVLAGEPRGGQVAVGEGLAGGETVVLSPSSELSEGQRVEVREG